MTGVTPELAAISRSIDPAELGRRLRLARVAAGMTQTDLAGEEITAAYVSRIESGARRPESGLLERMAGRLGVPLEHLLLGVSVDRQREIELALDYAELAAASGDAAGALKQAEAVLADLGETSPAVLRRRAEHLRALALESAGRIDEAIIALEDLTANPAADPVWLRELIALSRCYRETGEFARAIAVGEKAAATIADLGIEGLTEAIQLTVTVAGAYMQSGDIEHARRMCLRAIATAERYDSPVAQASGYWNASLIESRNGNHVGALGLAKKALALYELGEDSRNLGRLRAQIASMELRATPPDLDAARAALDQAAREMEWSAAGPLDLAGIHLVKARIELLAGATASAREQIAKGAELARDLAPLTYAETLVLHGRIAATEGAMDEARDLYQQAVAVLTGVGADRDAAQMWFELGGLLREAGDTDAALDAFQRASISTGLFAPNMPNVAVAQPAT
jgi:tetratricopeptide (TPR) repeat protein